MFCDLRRFRVFHQWGKWKVIGSGEVQQYSLVGGQLGTVGQFVRQQRQCEHCAKLELHDVVTK